MRVENWNAPDKPPKCKLGEKVAVEIKGKFRDPETYEQNATVSIRKGYYFNGLRISYEGGCGDCPHNGGSRKRCASDGGCPTYGFHQLAEHEDYDNFYLPVDIVIGWREVE